MTSADLTKAAAVMARWEQAVGNSGAMWDGLEEIGRAGGYPGGQQAMIEMAASGIKSKDLYRRVWARWAALADAAMANGDGRLATQVFAFAVFYRDQLHPSMRWQDESNHGFSAPDEEILRSLAGNAIAYLTPLDPTATVAGNNSGALTVETVLFLAKQCV